MPFGKHMGTQMIDVPAKYLLWLWDSGVWREIGTAMHVYIKRNFSSLESECRDYIVEHRPTK